MIIYIISLILLVGNIKKFSSEKQLQSSFCSCLNFAETLVLQGNASSKIFMICTSINFFNGKEKINYLVIHYYDLEMEKN